MLFDEDVEQVEAVQLLPLVMWPGAAAASQRILEGYPEGSIAARKVAEAKACIRQAAQRFDRPANDLEVLYLVEQLSAIRVSPVVRFCIRPIFHLAIRKCFDFEPPPFPPAISEVLVRRVFLVSCLVDMMED